jgi:dihydrofolate synthase / folylpolyglutamate synthase
MSDRILTSRSDVMEFLLEFADYEKVSNFKYEDSVFDLRRVELLMAAVGSPHRALKAVHIAGTKGKGSTAAMVQSILTEAGLRIGCFTSPHLVHLEERMAVDGELMSESELVALAGELVSYTDETRRERPHESPTFFELVTALGFMHFVREQVDVAVVEVGMGGRLDSTNVLLPEVSVITRIDFDHCEHLGHTLAKIAAEKGGIIKPGIPVVIGEQEPEALDTLVALAGERNASATCVGRDVTLESCETGLRDGRPYCRLTIVGRCGRYENIELGLLGRHQASNAANAVAAVEILAEGSGLSITEDHVRRGLAKARCPGRLEYFAGPPPILLDGAHNPVSIRVLREMLDSVFADHKKVLLFAAAADKDIDAMLPMILPAVESVVFTRSSNPRSEAPEVLVDKARHLGFERVEAVGDPLDAFGRVLEIGGEDSLVCVAGSLYLAGALRPGLLGSTDAG